jgi:hypothetical protein
MRRRSEKASFLFAADAGLITRIPLPVRALSPTLLPGIHVTILVFRSCLKNKERIIGSIIVLAFNIISPNFQCIPSQVGAYSSLFFAYGNGPYHFCVSIFS